MRLEPRSYFWICWNVRPTAVPSFSWLMPRSVRRWRIRAPTWTSTGCDLAISSHPSLDFDDATVESDSTPTRYNCARSISQSVQKCISTRQECIRHMPTDGGNQALTLGPAVARSATNRTSIVRSANNVQSCHLAYKVSARGGGSAWSITPSRSMSSDAITRPNASITAETPVLAARIIGNPSSTVRNRALVRCW